MCVYEAMESKAVETKFWVIISVHVLEYDPFFNFNFASEKSSKKGNCVG